MENNEIKPNSEEIKKEEPKKTDKIKKKKTILIICSALAAILACVCLVLALNINDNKSDDDSGAVEPTPVTPVIPDYEEDFGIDIDKYVAMFDEDKAINSDVQAILVTPSGLLEDQVVVQSSLDYANSTEYLRKDWRTGEYLSGGTDFIDGRNTRSDNGTYEDQNTIIYGHYVYHEKDPEQVTYFTPLHQLKDQANYEANKYFIMVYENEIVRYEVATLFYAELKETSSGSYSVDKGTTIPYYYVSYSDELFDSFISQAKEDEFYDTGVEITSEDKLLTLNTCVEYHDELRLIVVCKEVDKIEISR